MQRIIITIICLVHASGTLFAEKYQLRDGRILQGKHANVGGVVDAAPANEPKPRPVTVIDDGLRRVFMQKTFIQELYPDGDGETLETFKLKHQRVSTTGSRVAELGGYSALEPFDEHGRRAVELATAAGNRFTVQSITEINPRYIRVQALNFVWDARIATNSVPRSVLTPILMKQINPDSLTDRTRLVRFYVQADLYEDALAEVDAIEKDFGDESEVLQFRRKIKQLSADRLYKELEIRSENGQHDFVLRHLKDFPDEGVSVEILQKVRTMLREYETFEIEKTALLENLTQLHEKIKSDTNDEVAQQNLPTIESVLSEIKSSLSQNTIARLQAFSDMFGNPDLNDKQKIALAISGWIVGAEHVNQNLSVATSLYETRNLVKRFLCESDKANRDKIMELLRSQEAAQPEYVAAVLATMNPPFETDENMQNGYSEIETHGLGDSLNPNPPAFRYCIQLPPEYDPARRYPMIVSLNGIDTTPQQQIDFFAGNWNGNARLGHAGRNGYIVMAPLWDPTKRGNYEYDAMSHAAVLYTLRDAFRRFSVDTDRVFISGHGTGGECAWDIAVSHCDLWAGVIPFCCVAGKFVADYAENAKYVPFYYVGGELDGHRLRVNAPIFDRYVATQMKKYPATITLFLGRGPESYYEEILRVFDFMSKQRRNFNRTEFTVRTKRGGDTFFWNVELGDDITGMPGILDPIMWNKGGGVEISSIIYKHSNAMKISIGANFPNFSLFLTQNMLNIKQRVDIEINAKRYMPKNGFLTPSIFVMLNDARTRCDRKHPFWLRVERE